MNPEEMMHRVHIDSALLVAALAAVLLPQFAEASPITFQRAYGGPGDDIGFSAQQITDGGYIATGFYGVLTDSGYAWLIKTDEHGDTAWTRKLGGSWVEQTTDSGFVALGWADSSDSGPGGVCLVKTDARGDMLWTRIYAEEYGASMVKQTTDGGYIVTGNTSYFDPDRADVLLIKSDSNGDLVWRRSWGGSGDDVGNSVEQTTDGGYIIAANTMSFGAGSQDVWLIKTDSVGETLWTRTFGGDTFEHVGSAQQTTDGGYFVAGWTWSYSPSPEAYLIKTDAVGDTLWTRTIGGSGWFEGMSGQQVKDGGYIVGGLAEDTAGDIDVYLVRTDANGDTLWTRTIGGPSLDLGLSVRQTSDGGYVVCGETYSFGAGAADFYLIKTDENGNLAVTEPKSGPPRKPVTSLTCEPNPFRSSAVLHMTTGPLAHSVTHFRIYDVQGRLVRTLAVGQARETVWDGRNDAGQLLPSGTYLVRCDAAGKHATTRLVLQR